MGILPHVAARELGISPRTLDTWARAGRIRFTLTAGRWRMYAWADVQRMKKAMLKRQVALLRSVR